MLSGRLIGGGGGLDEIYIRSIGTIYTNGVGGKAITNHDAGTWEIGDLLIGWVAGAPLITNSADWTQMGGTWSSSNHVFLGYRVATGSSDAPTSGDVMKVASQGATGASICMAQVISITSKSGGTLGIELGDNNREITQDAFYTAAIGTGSAGLVVACYHRQRTNEGNIGVGGLLAPLTMTEPTGFEEIGRHLSDPYLYNTQYYYYFSAWGHVFQGATAAISETTVTPYPATGYTVSPIYSGYTFRVVKQELFAGGSLGLSSDTDVTETTVGFRFDADGGYHRYTNGTQGTGGTWLTSGDASLFEVKIEFSSGDFILDPPNISTWVPLTGDAVFIETTNPSAVLNATYTYEIREKLNIANNATGSYICNTEDGL